MDYDLELHSIDIEDVSVNLFIPREESIKRLYEQELLKKDHSPVAFPYWARLWPSSIALGTFLHQQPHYIKGKKVLELAAGLGLPSLLAARHAQSVCCSDFAPDALTVVNKSIEFSGLFNVIVRLLDWRHLPEELCTEVLLLSDINYDPQEFDVLYEVLLQFLQKNTIILLSTPQRLIAKAFINRLVPWCIQHEVLPIYYNREKVPISIFVFKRDL